MTNFKALQDQSDDIIRQLYKVLDQLAVTAWCSKSIPNFHIIYVCDHQKMSNSQIEKIMNHNYYLLDLENELQTAADEEVLGQLLHDLRRFIHGRYQHQAGFEDVYHKCYDIENLMTHT